MTVEGSVLFTMSMIESGNWLYTLMAFCMQYVGWNRVVCSAQQMQPEDFQAKEESKSCNLDERAAWTSNLLQHVAWCKCLFNK